MFILSSDRPDNTLEEWDAAWQAYQKYLINISIFLTSNIKKFLFTEWYFNFKNHHCPHDAKLASITVNIENKDIVIKLLGAFEDGEIEYNYHGVKNFTQKNKNIKYGYWHYDEIRVRDNSIVHEIEFEHSCIIIECIDITYKWTNF